VAKRQPQRASVSSTRLLGDLLDPVSIGVVVVDRTGSVREFNAAATEILGFSDQETVGFSIADWFEDGEGLVGSIRRCFEEDSQPPPENLSRRREGGEQIVQVTVRCRGAGKRARSAILFLQDVTERQLAESRFRTLIQNLDAILWEADRKSLQFRFVSQRAENILGYPVQLWLTNPNFWPSIIHEDDRAEAVRNLASAAEESGPNTFEYRVISADGRIVWLRVYVTEQEHGRDSILRGLMVDVTEQKRTEQELELSRMRFARMARTFQRSLLPPALPKIAGVEVAAAYRAAGEGNEVGGDFYDAFDVSDDEWALVMGDVCGKGPDAAAVTALARYTVRAAAQHMRQPVRILETLNEAILSQGNDRFCSMAYARFKLNGAAIQATVSVGGHPLPLVLRRDGHVETIGRHGLLLGVFPDPKLEEESTLLTRGDAVVLFTDGVTDAGAPGMPLGEEGLRAALKSGAGLGAAGIVERVEQAVLDRSSGAPRDDCAILVMRVAEDRAPLDAIGHPSEDSNGSFPVAPTS
jgi:PAS domain S-box-containing protein